MSDVKIIQPKKRMNYDFDGNVTIKKKRVCAYCRVSTDFDEQKTSYDAQIDEYTKRILENPEWEFAGIFADEGISGTSFKKRGQFNEMIGRVRHGEIDLIITKSISRFTRNTVDCLNFIREFRMINVEIFFEKENLYSSDPKVDFLISIMSSIAQEEARNISENVKWNIQKRFKEGVCVVNHQRFLGYTKDQDGNLVIVPEEAKIVTEIFTMYAAGIGPTEIRKYCQDQGYKTGAGRTKWGDSTIYSILKNEKYCGDLKLQKTITLDYLSHKRVKNRDLEPIFFKEDAHPAIISKELFNEVQQTISLRSDTRVGKNKDLAKYNRRYPFSGIIICNKCGRTLKRRYWNHGTPAARIVQLCGNYIEGKGNCDSKSVDQDLIEGATLDVINKVFKDNPDIFKNLYESIHSSLDNDCIQQLIDMEDKKQIMEDKLENLFDLQSSTPMPKELFQKKYNEATLELKNISHQIEVLEKRNDKSFEKRKRIESIQKFLDTTKNEGITELTVDIVKNFIYRMISVERDYMVFVLAIDVGINEENFIKNRENIINQNPIYVGSFINDKRHKILKYKVVML